MGSELPPKQIDQIRERWAPQRQDKPNWIEPATVVALCDTADAYWGLKAQLDRVLGDLSRQLVEANEGRAAAQRELKTLRGIAKRVSDGWGVIPPARRWLRPPIDGVRSFEAELMTEAEVAAIYATEAKHPPALSSEERERRRGLSPVERSLVINNESGSTPPEGETRGDTP